MTTDTNTASPVPTGGVGDSLIGKEIDGCTIVKKIGQGGMGIVYLAEHTKLKQQYVVKILNPALTAAEDTVQRFFREAQSVARLNHASIVGIQNVGQEGDYYYIRMEFVDGDTVENCVKEQKKLDWKLATKVVLDTAEALSHAHKKGIVHRDIKPENIMLTKTGDVKVMDFGLAKQVSAATKVSVTGQIVGTPFFMSPEQAGGKTTDARSDIYSLGVTYYYLLTGVKPFNGKNLQEIFLKHFFYTPESPKIYTPELPEAVCEIIRRCLKKKKKERYQSAAQLCRDLRVVLGLEQGELSAAPDGGGATTTSTDDGTAGEPANAGSTAVSGPGGASRGIISTQSDPQIPGADDLAATNRVFARSDSPGGGSDTLQTDLAAAQAELGGDAEPGTIVAGRRGGAGPDAGGDAPVEEAAPIQRRGNRVALDQVAGASLVFSGPPPAIPQEPVEVDTPVQNVDDDAIPDINTIPAAMLKGMDTVTTQGGKFVIPGLTASGEATRKVERDVVTPPKKKPPALAIGLVALGVMIGTLFGGFQFMAATQYGVLQKRFDDLLAATAPSTDQAGLPAWKERSQQFVAIANDTDQYLLSAFRMSSKATAAAELGGEARKQWAECEKTIRNIVGSGPVNTEAAEILKKKREHFDAEMRLYQDAFNGKRYEEAAKIAIELHGWTQKNLQDRLNQIRCPIEITTVPPGAKVLFEETVLGTTGGTERCIVQVKPFAPLALELRLNRFKPSKLTNVVTRFDKFEVELERDVLRRYSVGVTRPMPCFKLANVTFPVNVDASPMIDPIGKAQSASLNVVGRDGTLRALDLKGGGMVSGWVPREIGVFGDPSPGPDVLPGKAIATVTADGMVRVHRIEAGVAMWEKSVGAPVRAAPRFSPDEKTLVICTLEGAVHLFDAVNGVQKWKVVFEGPITTPPVFQGDKLFVGVTDDRLRRIDANTGKVEAVYDAKEAIVAGPVLTGQLVFVGTREGRVHAVNAASLTAAFTTAPAGAPIRQIVALPQIVYFSTDSELRTVDVAAQGNLACEPYRPGPDIVLAGFVPMNGGKVALVSTAGTVMALEGKTGNVLWFYEVKNAKGGPVSVSVPPLFHNDELFVVTREGEVVVLWGD